MYKIYLIHPITGLGYEEVHNYYTDMSVLLEMYGYKVIHPMTGKGYLRNEREFKPGGYTFPASTDHAIFSRDRWMVKTADVVYADLTGAKGVSIGSVMELAIAFELGKHVIVVMEDENPHHHAFVREASHVIFSDPKEGLDYLKKLASGSF